MKRELLIHFSFLISFFIFISIFKGWVGFAYWSFWLGGIVGNFLPDFDHFIYIYFLRPHELTSQRVNHMLGKGEVLRTFNLLAGTRSERKHLIFHSGLFQLIFLVLTFLVVTSSGSLFGRGIVLAFFLHLLVDQTVDLVELGSLSNWTRGISVEISQKQAKSYWLFMLFALLLLSFLF